MADLFVAKRCESCTTVADSDIFTLVLNGDGDKQLIISTSFNGAAQIEQMISGALAMARKDGANFEVPRIPEKIMNYAAEWIPGEGGGVTILLDGDRSNPLLGRMMPDDARRFAALLKAAAEGDAPKRANKH